MIRVILVGLLLAGIAFAQAPPAAAPEDAELEELLAVLAEETAIATQTKMNADLVPGIVTVLQSDEMEALGARNVGEAIALVPGLQANRDVYGLPLYFVRGIPFFDSAGGFKILVDGLTLSRENSGVSGSVLTMAIEQVDRIEVIRGPGAGVWGDAAFVGLINIVTRHDRNRGWLAGGNDSLWTGGAVARLDGERFDLSATASGWRSEGPDKPDGPLPGAAVADAEVQSGIGTVDARWGGFSLTGSAVLRNFGVTSPDPRHFPTDEESWTLQARHDWTLGPGRSVDVFAQYLDNDVRVAPISYDSRWWQAGADVAWKLGRHALLFRGSYAVNTLQEAIFVPPPSPPGQPPRPNTVVTDVDQKITSVVLQDSVDVGSAWTFTAGFRLDDQSDIGSSVTPRLAAVWRLGERHVIKAQYAEGFRAPTFQYLYDDPSHPETENPNVEFEEAETTDLAYIYRRPGQVVRLTVFHSDFSNLRIPPPPYRTGATAEATGAEVEWEQHLGERLKLIANLSWVNPDDERPHRPEIGAAESIGHAEWIGNLALLGRLPGDVLVGLHWNHLGQRDIGTTPAGESKSDDGYELVNFTATWTPPRCSHLSLRGGVRNLLDDEVFAVYYFVGQIQRPAYGGRQWTLQASWTF